MGIRFCGCPFFVDKKSFMADAKQKEMIKMCEAGKYKWGENEKTFFNKKNDTNAPNDNLGDMRLFPDDLLGSTASATECTGLVPAGVQSPDEAENYAQLYAIHEQKPAWKRETNGKPIPRNED